MDPYLEAPDLWPDVHHALISAVQEQLTVQLRSHRYVARVELRTFMFAPDDPASELYVIPDARIVERQPGAATNIRTAERGGTAVAEVVTTPGIDVTGLAVKAARDRFIEIRDPANRHVVTLIEIVSPSNKVVGSAGRRAFSAKRQEVADSDASWLEIDLLRQGTPTITFPNVPASAYRAYVDRTATDERHQIFWPIPLRNPLPTLPVPLRPGESDVTLDLQAALNTAYDRAGYDLDVNFSRPPVTPLNAEDSAWSEELLRAKGLNA